MLGAPTSSDNTAGTSLGRGVSGASVDRPAGFHWQHNSHPCWHCWARDLFTTPLEANRGNLGAGLNWSVPFIFENLEALLNAYLADDASADLANRDSAAPGLRSPFHASGVANG